MIAIQTSVEVGPDRRVVLQLPTDISEGPHQLVVMIDPDNAPKPPNGLGFSAYPVGLVSEQFTFRREDLYDDTGR